MMAMSQDGWTEEGCESTMCWYLRVTPPIFTFSWLHPELSYKQILLYSWWLSPSALVDSLKCLDRRSDALLSVNPTYCALALFCEEVFMVDSHGQGLWPGHEIGLGRDRQVKDKGKRLDWFGICEVNRQQPWSRSEKDRTYGNCISVSFPREQVALRSKMRRGIEFCSSSYIVRTLSPTRAEICCPLKGQQPAIFKYSGKLTVILVHEQNGGRRYRVQHCMQLCQAINKLSVVTPY
jgi:hypothetical protein